MSDAIKKQKKRRWGWWVVLAVVIYRWVVIVIRIRNNRLSLTESLANLETEPYQRQNLNASITVGHG